MRYGSEARRETLRGVRIAGLAASAANVTRGGERTQVLEVGVPELRAILRGGAMLLPALATCHLALEALQARGLLPPP